MTYSLRLLLIQGKLKVNYQYNLKDTEIFEMGHQLNDMEWHHVTLTIDRRRHITVRLDELETSRLLDVEEGRIKMDGPLYVGGDVEKPTLG